MPEKFILKTPSDGLCGKTDEDNLGVTYKEIDDYIMKNRSTSVIIKTTEADKRIFELHRKSKVKRDKLNIPGPLLPL